MSQITPPPQIIYTQPERKFITYQNIPQRLSLKIRAVIRSIPGISPPFLAGFRDMIDTEWSFRDKEIHSQGKYSFMRVF